jgi:hypothetical protein
MNAATEDASEEDEEIPTLCDLDESQAEAAATADDDKQLPPVPVTILTGAHYLGVHRLNAMLYILFQDETMTHLISCIAF